MIGMSKKPKPRKWRFGVTYTKDKDYKATATNIKVGKKNYSVVGLSGGSEYAFTPSEIKKAEKRARKLKGMRP